MIIMEKKLVLLDEWLEFLKYENIRNENDIKYLMNKLDQNDEAFKKKHLFGKMLSFKSYLMTQNNRNFLLNRFFTFQANIKQEYRIIFSFRSFLFNIENLIFNEIESHKYQLLEEDSYYQIETIYNMLNDLLKQILSEKKADYSKENLKLFIIFERARPCLLHILDDLQKKAYNPKQIFLKWANLERRAELLDYFNDKNNYSFKDCQLSLSFKNSVDILSHALSDNWDYETYKKMCQLHYNIRQISDVATALLDRQPKIDEQPQERLLLGENMSFFDESDLIHMKKKLLQQMKEQSLMKQDNQKRESIQDILAIDLELKRRTQG